MSIFRIKVGYMANLMLLLDGPPTSTTQRAHDSLDNHAALLAQQIGEPVVNSLWV